MTRHDVPLDPDLAADHADLLARLREFEGPPIDAGDPAELADLVARLRALIEPDHLDLMHRLEESTHD